MVQRAPAHARSGASFEAARASPQDEERRRQTIPGQTPRALRERSGDRRRSTAAFCRPGAPPTSWKAKRPRLRKGATSKRSAIPSPRKRGEGMRRRGRGCSCSKPRRAGIPLSRHRQRSDATQQSECSHQVSVNVTCPRVPNVMAGLVVQPGRDGGGLQEALFTSRRHRGLVSIRSWIGFVASRLAATLDQSKRCAV